MVGSESKPRILRIPVHVSLHSAHVILSLPESLSSLCTALYPAAAAAAKRAVHASQFWPPFLNSNQICCLLLSIRRYDRGRDRGERPFFFGGPKSKALCLCPSAAPSALSVLAQRRPYKFWSPAVFGVPLWFNDPSALRCENCRME